MVKCFLTSINGAGPIRTIAQIQLWLGCGPILCQNQYGGMASQCQVQYVNRLMLIGLFTQYAFGMYVMLRNNSKLTKVYIQETSGLRCLSLMTFAFGYLVPQAEWILHFVFGEPRSMHATAVVLIAVATKITKSIREYQAVIFRGDLSSSYKLKVNNTMQTSLSGPRETILRTQKRLSASRSIRRAAIAARSLVITDRAPVDVKFV